MKNSEQEILCSVRNMDLLQTWKNGITALIAEGDCVSKIMIDLDVMHVEFSKKMDERKAAVKEFLNKLNQFEIHTPHVLIDTVEQWRDKELVTKIKNFYELNSKHIISAKEIADKLEEIKLDTDELKSYLKKTGIKDEDILLIIVADIFGLDSIVTFNKKHLLNNKEKVNKILRRFGLNEIKIEEPS